METSHTPKTHPFAFQLEIKILGLSKKALSLRPTCVVTSGTILEMDSWLGTRWGGDLKDPRDNPLVVNHTKCGQGAKAGRRLNLLSMSLMPRFFEKESMRTP